MEIHERQHPDLTRDEKELLLEAGASKKLIEMADFDIREMERDRDDGKAVSRNSVLEEVKKYVRGTGNVPAQLTEAKVDAFSPYGGDFFMHVWNGDLYSAYGRADYNNQAILLELFGTRRINQDKPNHRKKVTA